MAFDEFDDAIINDYVAESKEHLETIEDDFLALEKNKDQMDQARVDKVFRAIHSIKGAAGFLGFNTISELAHVMETLLSMLRKGEIKAESRFIDALLEGVDHLNLMLDDVKQSNSVDIGKIHGRLTDLIANASSPAAQQDLATAATLSDDAGRDIDFDISKFSLDTVPKEFSRLYLLKFDLAGMSKDQGKTPVGLVRQLQSKGTIVDGQIEALDHDLRSGLPEGPLNYLVLYATALTLEALANEIDLPAERITAVQRGGEPVATAAVTPPAPKTEAQEKKAPEAEKPAKAVSAEKKPAAAKKTESVAPPAAPAAGVVEKPAAAKAPAAEKFASPPAPARQDKGDAQPRPQPPKSSDKEGLAPVAEAKSAEGKGNTIRIGVDIVDTLMMLAGELVLVRNQQLLNVDRTDPVARSIVQRLDIVTSELQETIMRTRMQPIDNVFGKFPRVVRELAKKLGKQIELTMKGNEVELDKTILESLADPLTHLIRNCCDHGLEEAEIRASLGKPAIGRVWLSAYHEGGLINIEIKDDGRGIDPEALKEAAVKKGLKTEAEVAQLNDKEAISLIMLPGFSMARKVSDVSGRGVGMDVVKTNLEKLGGAVDIESRLGEGTIVHLRLPLTLAIIPCLIVMVGNYRYAIPQVNLEELVALYDQDVLTKLEYTGDREVYRLRKRLLPMIRLQEVLARPKPFTDKACAQVTEKYRKEKETKLADYQAAKKKGAADAESIVSASLNFVVLKVGADRFGLIVDRVLGTEEIVVKPMHPALKALPCYSGATVMGDGQVALILDIEGISAYAGLRYKAIGGSDDQAVEGRSDEGTQTVLLFKNGAEEQFALALPLIRRIERIDPAGIEPVGNKEFISIDGQSTLILRLDKHLNVSPCVMRDEMFLLLPKHTKRPFGILVSTLLDIAEAPLELNIESYQEPGLLGTAIIRDHITLFVDMYRLIEKAEPGWFGTPVQKNSGGKAVHILLAEDSPFFRQMIRGYLEDNGYQVTVAENGKIALNFLNEDQFDLIVSDLEMPEMNGWEFMQEVRSGSNQRDIPSLALTSLESGKHRDRALQVGFNRYEVKIDRLRLLEAVSSLLHEKS